MRGGADGKGQRCFAASLASALLSIPPRPRNLCPAHPLAPLQQLRRKADERNPDEFYFAMEKARTSGGVHLAPSVEAHKYSQGELALMKSQDVGYLSLKAQAEAKVRVCAPMVCARGWG